MKVKFQRTGGFANIPVNVEVDSANMEPDLSNQLSDLVGKVLFTNEKVEPFPDGCTYDLTVENNGQEQTLNTNDAHITDDMHNLFDFLLQLVAK